MSDDHTRRESAGDGPPSPRSPATSDRTSAADDTFPRGSGAPAEIPMQLDAVEWPVVESGRFASQGEHARGGLGRIVQAIDCRLARVVALKELLRDGGSSEARFIREALITATLQHPSIVPVYEVGRWPSGKPFYSMKMVSGRSLADALRDRKTLTQRLELLPNVISVTDAIAYAHQRRIIHRDLKPQNVMLGGFGETVVVDWGLALDLSQADRGIGEATTAYQVAAAGLTATGAVIGTPEYMPPEQASGSPLDARADVYALGAILYHMLAGAPPYTGRNSAEVLAKVSSEPPIPLEQREPGVPPDLAAIVRKAMARNVGDRYPSAKELAEELRRFQTGQLVKAYNYSWAVLLRRWLKRHRASVGAAALLLVVAAVIGIVALAQIVQARNQAQAKSEQLRRTEARNVLDKDPTKVLAWLRTYPVNLQNWSEVRNLAADALSRGVARHVLKTGSSGGLTSIQFSPTGEQVATASIDNTVRLWDVNSGKEIARHLHSRWVEVAEFAPKPGLLALGGADGQVHLWQLQTGVIRPLPGNTGFLRALDFSADGTALAGVGDSGDLNLWSIPDGEVRVFRGHRGSVRDVVFFPDGTRVATSGDDGTVRLWHLPSGTGQVLHDHSGAVSRIRVSGSGEILVSAGSDGNVFVYRLSSGLRPVLRRHGEAMSGLELSPDEKSVALGGNDRALRLWTLETGAERVLHWHDGPIRIVQFSADGRWVASGGEDGAVRLASLSTLETKVLLGHTQTVNVLHFSRDSRLLASGSFDGTGRIWKVELPRTQILRVDDESGAVYHIAYSSDGKKLASGGLDWNARVWDLSTGDALVLQGHGGQVNRVLFSPQQTYLATTSSDKTARLWNLKTAQSHILVGHTGVPRPMCFTADESTFVTASDDQTVRVWDTKTGALTKNIDAPISGSASNASPDCRVIGLGAPDNALHLLAANTWEDRALHGHRALIYTLLFSPDGNVVATAARDGTVRAWDLRSGSSTVFDQGASEVRRFAFSPDNNWLATAADDGFVRLWNLSNRSAARLGGHDLAVWSVAFSPDGKSLLSAGKDKSVRVWDLMSGVRQVLRGHTNVITNAIYSPDGRTVASSSADRTIRLWPVDPQNSVPQKPEDLPTWLGSLTTYDLPTEEVW